MNYQVVKRELYILAGLAATLFSALILGCGIKPPAKGGLEEIYVFADEEVYRQCSSSLSVILTKPINTPQSEPVFILQKTPWAQFPEKHQNANLLLLGSIESGGEVSQFVKNMLDENTLKGVRDGVYWLFSKNDPWNSGQLLVIAVANDALELNTRFQFEGAELFQTVNQACLQRLRENMFARNENEELETQLQDKYGFSLRVQQDYFIVNEDSAGRLLRLRRSWGADRFLSVSWSQEAVDTITNEMAVSERQRIGKLFADPVIIYPEYNEFETVEDFYPGSILMRGLWGLESNLGGGPFFTIALRDSVTGRAYYVDGSVFAPDREKMPFLRQLEVIARTFKPPSSGEKRR